MKASTFFLAVGTVLAVKDGGDSLPVAYGISLDSIIGQYFPAILAVVVALVNESENIAPFIKKIVTDIGKSKGVNIETGEKAIALWKAAIDLLNEIKKDPESEEMAVDAARDLVTAMNRKVIEEAVGK